MAVQKKMGRILVADDDPEVRNYLELSLKCCGYDVVYAEDGSEAISALKEQDNGISLVLLDIMMPIRDGIDTLREIRRIQENLPVVMLSGVSAPGPIIETMKAGATDYLIKPVSDLQLRKTVESTLARYSTQNAAKSTRAVDKQSATDVTWKASMADMFEKIGHSDAPVLIVGETGVGKEVVARLLHSSSPRATRPFLKVNCAAIPSELVESELFGYERGAFTGALKDKPGKFEVADGGTIFLDEIGDMEFRLQAKLLQVLQDHEFHRVGGTETVRVDVRVMAATHTDLEKAMRSGRFREDLYYRLNIVNIHVPPLRERPDEIVPLAQHFMEKHSRQSSPALEIDTQLGEALLGYSWPGNVRELENIMRRYLVLRDSRVIAQDLLRNRVSSAAPASLSSQAASAEEPRGASSYPPASYPIVANPSSPQTLGSVTEAQKRAERDAILEALGRTRWNRKKAAALLRVDYKALLYKMKKLGIDDGLPGGSASGEAVSESVGAA